MARRHSKQVIEPFPAEIDREYFASWLSGFTDGEGCFLLFAGSSRGRPRFNTVVQFKIALRQDDAEIIYIIQRFFQCGAVALLRATPDLRGCNKKPQVSFYVQSARDLLRSIIPHFLKHPLLAKKSRDFLIWKEGVELVWSVAKRKRQNRRLGPHGGTYSKWLPHERARFLELVAALKAQRVYQAPAIVVPAANGHTGATLFDGLD